MEAEEEARRVGQFLRKEVEDWDDEVMASARYQAFSGQRSDWEHKYLFWRHLIIHVARHLRLFIIQPSQVKSIWFNREGLTPLCLDQVLVEMYSRGDIVRSSDLLDPTRGRLSQILRRVVHLVGVSRTLALVDFTEDHLILSTLLKDKAAEVVKVLSENHWTSSCIITMRKFQDLCGGCLEASSILSHLSECGKAKYLVINKKDVIEGVKVSVSSGAAVSSITNLDYDLLQLIWTSEKLQKQLHVVDERCAMSRGLALASLKSGNKLVALRHVRELKLASQSREKCTAFCNRVDEVLGAIADNESSEKVCKAIQLGAQALKENKISLNEVELCLQELNDSIDSHQQVEKVLESTPSYSRIEDQDIEDELKILELAVEMKSSPVPISNNVCSSVREAETSETAESLSGALSDIKLTDDASIVPDSLEPSSNILSKNFKLEAT